MDMKEKHDQKRYRVNIIAGFAYEIEAADEKMAEVKAYEMFSDDVYDCVGTVYRDYADVYEIGNGVMVHTADDKPQTNADRIRAMSEEELAKFFNADWINQPVEEV